MKQRIEIAVSPEMLQDEKHLEGKIRKKLGLEPEKEFQWKMARRSLDARGRNPVYRCYMDVFLEEPLEEEPLFVPSIPVLKGNEKICVVIGAGPAGYFAALQLLERGIKPIVLERGKDVRARRRDLRAIQQFGEVNPHSNYCFGEGGAGTYSDGKLYTRSHKRGSIYKALRILVEHGAKEDILVDSHPHIGSNKLPKIVSAIRETIESRGGEVRFDHFVDDFIIKDKKIIAVRVNGETEIKGDAFILATGHSARDVYKRLHELGVSMESKPFALGVRIEHPQPLIDGIQYGRKNRGPHLPASSYKLVSQVKGRGVFSFCMCPGGLVVPAATAPGEIVVNGMSMSRRDSPYANSGIVVAVEQEDFSEFKDQGVFAGMAFQAAVEKAMFNFGDGSQKAPAQRLTDFVHGKLSSSLPGTSYIPGLISAPLHTLLPKGISARLKQGLQDFGKKMRGYYTNDAIVIGTESRTSSPVKIPRGKETLMHPEINGLFPCGEGPGFAGGIISAAMDGQNCGDAVARFLDT